jgi:FixJ family two-component response regulator
MIDRIDTKPIVYLVSPNFSHLDHVQSLLEGRERLETECYGSVRQFVDAYRPDRLGCLLIDFSLDGSGLELCDELAASGVHLPVVFLASGASVSQCAAAMRAGAFDFVECPTPEERLLEAVRSAIQQDRVVQEKRNRRYDVLQRMRDLTARERETMDLVIEGLNTKQIASRFGIGFQTAAKHRARLLTKMSVRNDAQLVRLCIANEVLEPALSN